MTLKQTYAREEIHFRWESVYRNHPLLNYFNDNTIDRMLKHLHCPPNALLLDAGCGIGDHSLRIAERGYRCVGIDLSETVLKAARKGAAMKGLASRTSFICQALEELAFDDDTFDAIHCRGVLMHIPQWEKALTSLCRVLKPGGRIAIFESNHKSLEMAIVLAVRKVQSRNSKMIKTEGGFEFWSEENGQPFVVRVANIQRLTSALEANGTFVLKTVAHEFWDINRFPAGAIRNAAIRYNYVYFLLGLPHFACMGNMIIAEKQGRNQHQ